MKNYSQMIINYYGCELCDSNESKRRKDNIHVCDECDDKYPIGK